MKKNKLKSIMCCAIIGTFSISAISCGDKTEISVSDTINNCIEYAEENNAVKDNNEIYDSYEENGYKNTKSSPVSTFSTDVDTASYANVRRQINNGGKVNSDSVRIEEMINYFNYNYEKPEGDNDILISSEFSDCPWNSKAKLLQIGLKAKEIDEEKRPLSNFTFLIDVSGSMVSNDKLPLIKKSFKKLCENLKEGDKISIVTYSGKEEVLIDNADGFNDKNKILSAVKKLNANGCTNGESGINKAYELAEKNFIEGGNNRIIMATDGDLNVGISSKEELTDLIKKKRESGVYLSVIGVGSGNLKDSNLESLADNGDGNYSYIDNEIEAEKVFKEELTKNLFLVAKDAKIQVTFNRDNVKEYRLVGYENRMMKSEDFNDDSKDAGDIGVSGTVTALYEVILNDSNNERVDDSIDTIKMDKDDIVKIDLRYKKIESNESTLLQSVVKKDDYKEDSSEDFKFASCVAMTGMLLKNSEYSGTSAYNDIYERLKAINEIGKDKYKNEFLLLVGKLKQ